MEVSEIEKFLSRYFEVLQTQDLEEFDRVFHPGCVLYSQQDGATVVRPLAEYRTVVQGRESPKSRGFKPENEIVTIDVLSPEMAMAKVRLHLFENVMADYLCLLKIDGKWTIVSKLFHRAGAI